LLRRWDHWREVDPPPHVRSIQNLPANHGINFRADFWQRTLGLRLFLICNALTFPSPYFDVTETLVCECAALVPILANPVLHQSSVFYEGNGENSWDN